MNYVVKLKGKVKYHKNKDCEALNRGLRNFFIPELIAILKENNPEKHKDLVIAIRECLSKITLQLIGMKIVILMIVY